MLKRAFQAVLAASVAVLLMPSAASAYGAAHVGYTHVGPNGVYHTGETVARGPGGTYVHGGTTAAGYGGGAYHSGYSAGYERGYGGAAYGAHYSTGAAGYQYVPSYSGGAAYGAGYHYGYVR